MNDKDLIMERLDSLRELVSQTQPEHLMYDDKDSIGDLILQSPSSLLSWGIQEQTDMNSGVKTGYTLPITLFSKEGATEEQERVFRTDAIPAWTAPAFKAKIRALISGK